MTPTNRDFHEILTFPETSQAASRKLLEYMTRRAFLSVTVLIIYNMGAGEKLISTRSRPACPKNIIFAHSQKTYENLMDFKHFCFRPNSPRELSFFFLSHV